MEVIDMKKIIKYNTQIFLTWFNYILLGKKLSKEAIELIKNNYNATLREKRLFDRVENKNK
jgi:hypothetical protein